MKQYITPYLVKNDRPRNRQLYNDTKDVMHRDGIITDWQVRNWVYPSTNAFLAASEKRIVEKGKKK